VDIRRETVSAPRSLRESFETARRVAAYAYFYPQRRLFSASDGFLARERKSAALDAGIFETLGEGLRRHDFNLAASAMGSAMDFARSDRPPRMPAAGIGQVGPLARGGPG
jgi:hypothetical protein